MKKDIKVLFQLSQKDQKELGYDTQDFDFDFEELMKRDFVLPITDSFRAELIKAIRNKLRIPNNYLSDYDAIFKEGVILVLCYS